ncbi:UBE2G2 [Acanthosepion pharaonis]|uniref:Ubiquitin-conjugating enzyme E2 G2 n=1 Tax=Acanthosepion pharaonis TaxID=158019 RepID=A0A812AQ18_ACAPH|nr:UBE2G2 [Sepia pharaonis]
MDEIIKTIIDIFFSLSLSLSLKDARALPFLQENFGGIDIFQDFFFFFSLSLSLSLVKLTLNPPEGIIAGPVSEENFFEWEALIMGPEGTCFEGGVFPARLMFPPDYPLSPPKMKFNSEIFHPNIYVDGRVCISILHAPGDDPMGYETSAERWSPVQSVEKILLSVVSMLAEPNDESAANVDAAKTWREDRQRFNDIARRTVEKSLGL